MDPDLYDPINQMCEVVMEEGGQDDEESVPIATENLDLPPIPRFDLQSEQFTYFPPPPLKSHITLPLIQPEDSRPVPPNSKPKRTIMLKPLASLQGPVVVEKRMQSSTDFNSTNLVPSIIFGLPVFKKIYISPDKASKDLQTVSAEELKFYTEYFSDTSRVSQFRLHCTTCDKHIGCGSSALNVIKLHRGLFVLVCKRCYDFYGDDKFPTDKEDNTEVFCRWCGQGGKLVCCSYCPKVFCYKCITRNFRYSYLKDIEAADDWACFFCAQKPLWPLRAIARALVQYLKQTPVSEDRSECCKKKPTPHKDPKVVENPMVVFNTNVSNLIRGNSPMVLPKPRMPIVNSPNARFMNSMVANARRLVAPTRTSRPLAPPVFIAPKAPQMTPIRLMSGGPRPGAPPNIPPPNKMREVLVDHTKSNATIVRLTNVGGREHYIRIVVTGHCMKIPKPAANPSFFVKSLEHAFQISKMSFERLMELNKAENTPDDEKAESLLKVLDGWKSLIGYVESDLKHNLNLHRTKKSESGSSSMQWDFVSKCKGVFDHDSDIEIIEEEGGESNDSGGKENSRKRKNSGGDEPSSKTARTNIAKGNKRDKGSIENDNNMLVNGERSSDGMKKTNSKISNNKNDSSEEIVDLDTSDPTNDVSENVEDNIVALDSSKNSAGTEPASDRSDVKDLSIEETTEMQVDGDEDQNSRAEDGENDSQINCSDEKMEDEEETRVDADPISILETEDNSEQNISSAAIGSDQENMEDEQDENAGDVEGADTNSVLEAEDNSEENISSAAIGSDQENMEDEQDENAGNDEQDNEDTGDVEGADTNSVLETEDNSEENISSAAIRSDQENMEDEQDEDTGNLESVDTNSVEDSNAQEDSVKPSTSLQDEEESADILEESRNTGHEGRTNDKQVVDNIESEISSTVDDDENKSDKTPELNSIAEDLEPGKSQHLDEGSSTKKSGNLGENKSMLEEVTTNEMSAGTERDKTPESIEETVKCSDVSESKKCESQTEQDEADIMQLFDGELSRIEKERSIDELSNASGSESPIKFDQALLDEIDSIG